MWEEEITPKETVTARLNSRQKEIPVTLFSGALTVVVHDKMALCLLSISTKGGRNRPQISARVWFQFLCCASRIQEFGPWVWTGFWELQDHWGFPHFTDTEKEAQEFIHRNLSKIGTKLQVTWFSSWRQDSASCLLGPSHAPGALPVSCLPAPASAKSTPQTGMEALTSDRACFKAWSPLICWVSSSKLHDLSLLPFPPLQNEASDQRAVLLKEQVTSCIAQCLTCRSRATNSRYNHSNWVTRKPVLGGCNA